MRAVPSIASHITLKYLPIRATSFDRCACRAALASSNKGAARTLYRTAALRLLPLRRIDRVRVATRVLGV